MHIEYSFFYMPSQPQICIHAEIPICQAVNERLSILFRLSFFIAVVRAYLYAQSSVYDAHLKNVQMLLIAQRSPKSCHNERHLSER